MGSSKHEARASLLSGSASDISYPPTTAESLYQPYVGGYHYREGLQPASPKSLKGQTSCLFLPNSRWTWVFFTVTLIQAMAALAMEAWVFAQFQLSLLDSHTKTIQSTITTYLSLFIFGFFYQIILVMDALRLKNTIQVIGLCLYNVGLLIEAAIQRDQIRDAIDLAQKTGGEEQLGQDFFPRVNPVIIALPFLLALCTILLSATAWKLYEEFSWSIYKHISADLRLKQRYLSYQIYISLLKFDFFFFLAFTVQFLVVVVNNTADIEFWLTIAAIPVTVAILFLAVYWTRKESVPGMILIIIVYFGAMGYFVFKLVRMYLGNSERMQAYLPARRSLTAFAGITLTLLIVTISYAVVCTFNFNKGLKPYLQSGSRRRVRQASQDLDRLYPQDNVPLAHAGHQRMTID